MDQIVGELFLKASHIILGARTTQAARAPQRKAAKSWVSASFRISKQVVVSQHGARLG